MGFKTEQVSPEKQKVVQIIQTFFSRGRYAGAYQRIKAEYDVDIAQQSKINFQRLLAVRQLTICCKPKLRILIRI